MKTKLDKYRDLKENQQLDDFLNGLDPETVGMLEYHFVNYAEKADSLQKLSAEVIKKGLKYTSKWFDGVVEIDHINDIKMRERLEILRGEEKELKQTLKVNIEEQHRLMIMIYGEDTGICENGLVHYKGKLAKVTGFDCNYKVTPRVTYYNKDMQLSKREISAWDTDNLNVFSE